MCGIFGYIGPREMGPLLLEGLRSLEYRGYDSAGIAVLGNGLIIRKNKGKISALAMVMENDRIIGSAGISHTRWATHGEPSIKNAHPHTDCKEKIALVHNGIIENHTALKALLVKEGHKFTSDTDTEVLSHLIEKYYNGNLEKAVAKALSLIDGTYGIAVIHVDEKGKIVAARKGSPLILGLGNKEYFVASDAAPIAKYTKKIVYLHDGEIAVLSKKGYFVTDLKNQKLQKDIDEIKWNIQEIEKGGFDHFMQKEIFEQPNTIINTIRGRINPKKGEVVLGGIKLSISEIKKLNRIIITACGTSWHSALIAEYMFEELLRIPVEVEYASEFRYRNPILSKDDLVIAISQSGETADTLAAVKEAKLRGAKVLGIVNVVGSSIARECGQGVYVHAGPEIGVASTKAFTSQVTALLLVAIFLGQKKGILKNGEVSKILDELEKIPRKAKLVLEANQKVYSISKKYYNTNNFLYLGRGINFPVALEGALKLKEISYIHAEGYPAAEMKHGPIALIDEDMPVVVVAPKDGSYEKVLSNIAEIKSRKGRIIAIATENDKTLQKIADHTIFIPQTISLLSPLLAVIPLQLLSYHIAVLRGCDVDQPRNLAKSVTVE